MKFSVNRTRFAIVLLVFAVASNAFGQRGGRGPNIPNGMPDQGAAPNPKRFLETALFEITLSGFETDHHHWRGPTNISFKRNGQWEMSIPYISNMKRTHGFLDLGSRACVSIRFKFFEKQDCTGEPVATEQLLLFKCLEYKEEAKNLTHNGRVADYSNFIKSQCFITEQAWGSPLDLSPFN
jgi:hypothetical protein